MLYDGLLSLAYEVVGSYLILNTENYSLKTRCFLGTYFK